jgi:hypothetical protein
MDCSLQRWDTVSRSSMSMGPPSIPSGTDSSGAGSLLGSSYLGPCFRSLTRSNDVVAYLDRFEHLPDPFEDAGRLVSPLRPGGVLRETGGLVDGGSYPCQIHEGIRRLDGGRWEICFAGVDLRRYGTGLFIRPGIEVAPSQRFRFLAWGATGLWLPRTPGKRFK